MKNEELNSVPTVSDEEIDPEQVPSIQDSGLTDSQNKNYSSFVTFIKEKKQYFLSVVTLLLFVIVVIFIFNITNEPVAVKQFTNVYSFVPEKISKSAPIRINLPDGVDEIAAQAGITFSPEVEGEWQADDVAQVITFKPDKPLKSGIYYAVNMDVNPVQMSGDFYVDEDPQIEAVFPASNSESPEDTEITIVFNRPMVPLTTLTEQERVELPITITPPTPGKFKWISTRNLQFIPETTLVPSSDYKVEIGEGLVSLDGLPVAPITHSFVTRPLRYEYVSNGQISYRSPIIVDFNQPFDIDKTKGEIAVSKQNDETVSIEVEYGETTYYDSKSRKYVTETDNTKLFIYQKKDSHGRGRLWDFDTTYKISIKGATPLTGTKNLTVGKNSTVSVPNIVENVSADSDRSTLVRSDLLDPQGKLRVTFYEEVDKDQSDIEVKGLNNIAYGERCKTDDKGNTIYVGSRCEMEADQKVLIFSFNEKAFVTDESFPLELKKIETPSGFKINADPISIPLKTYPDFKIISTHPQNQANSAPVDGMFVCSNVPLKKPDEVGLSSYVETDGYIVFGRWSQSRYIYTKGVYDHCNSREFETNIRYGLLPSTDYNLKLSLTSEFEQTTQTQLAFKTEPPKEKYTRFHNMQQQYNVTTPDRTKFTYAVENLEYVDLHICKMEPETFLQRVVNQAESDIPPRSDGCTQVAYRRIDLPARYWVNNYFQVNLADYFSDTRGHYIITFSNPLYKDAYSKNQAYDRTYVSVTNLSVGKKEIEYADDSEYRNSYYKKYVNPAKAVVLDKVISDSKNLYWVNNSQFLTPTIGASVTQYKNTKDNSIAPTTSGLTNAEGIARVSIQQGLIGAVIRSGLDTAVVSDWADTLESSWRTQDASRTYIYTDRPIYRPGHTVHIRGIDRIGFDGSYEVWNKEPVNLEVYNSREEKVYEVSLSQSDYGTFNTEFELPSDAPLGNYRIQVFENTARFSVEEYVPAAFKLEAESSKTEYINGDTMKIDVQADYYFGVPLSEGTISYSVTAQDYYFDRYTDEYFNFGQSWYYCYSCGYGDDFLFRGETNVNEKGHAIIERELDFKDYFDDVDSEGSKLMTVFITAKDINGRSVSMQKSFIVHKGEFYLGAKTDQYYTGVNSPVTFRVKTVDTEGKPVALSGIDRTVYKVQWETFKRQEVDGGFYYRSEKKLTEVSSEKIKTDAKGDWSGALTFAEEGQYEIQVSKEDGRGHKIKTVSNIYIYGSRAVAVPPNNNYELDLEVEKTSLEVGDKASLLIKSPYDNAKVLISVERGTVYDYWIAEVKGGLYLHEFPIKSEYAPNIFVSALLLSGNPEVKYGSVSYEVGSKEHKLDVSVTANKAYYLPGEEVTLKVVTKDHTGQAVPAEVSLAVADLSVLALKGNPKKNPLLFFYDGFPLSVTTASNIKNILHEVDIPLGTKGGGGASPDDLAKKKRGVFKDTAFWQADVTTNQNGEATVSFTLPDNLTTWQVEGLGVTKDTKLGVDYQEFTTKKDLMAVPLKPRFVVPGDKFSLGAKVFNQTDHSTTVKIKLESQTLKFSDEQEDSVFINQGESKTVYFDVEAPAKIKAGEHTFTFTASDESFIDSVEQTIPITPNTTYETVATANFTNDDRAVEYIYLPDQIVSGEGGLTINVNATLAVFMTDALSYMVTYPYGCSEQLVSSLSTIGTLTEVLTVPNVEGQFETIKYDGVEYTVDTVIKNGLSQIYQTQTSGGGFAYYKGLPPSLSLTTHVALALMNLKNAGYEIREDVLQRAYNFIEIEAKNNYSRSPEGNKEAVILAEYTLRQINPNKDSALASIVKTLIVDKAFINEKISSMTLAYLSILTAENYSRSDRDLVYTTLKNRIDIDGRGAYLTNAKTANREYYETPIKNTALLLKAFAAHADDNPAMANVLRWLLASRDKSGAWGNTQNTFVVVDAMVDYLKWQHETESHFTLSGILEGVEIFGFEFSPKNIFETFTHFIATDDIPKNKLIPLELIKENKNNLKSNLYYDMTLKYFLPVESLPPRDEGITITRNLFVLTDTKQKDPITKATVGEVIKGKMVITIPDQYSHVAIEDFIPAGFEIVNFNLETEDKSLQDDYDNNFNFGGYLPSVESKNWLARIGNVFGGSQTARAYQANSGGSYGNDTRKLRPTHIESHDDRVFLYVENLSKGVYEYEYYLRALVPGEFQYLPARAEELYFPEVFGRTEGGTFKIIPAS